MKVGELQSSNFVKSMHELMQKSLPVKTSYKLKKLVEVLEKERVHYEKQRMDIINQWGVKTEDGSVKTNEQGGVEFASHDDMMQAGKALNELYTIDITHEIEHMLISLDDLGDINVSTETLIALSPIFKPESL